jgi:FMN phosphatase YigB (HAD superfamily)
MKIVLVDFDNTLFNTNPCVEAAIKEIWGIEMSAEELRRVKKEGKSAVYSLAYTKYHHLALPNSPFIEYIKRKVKEGDKVFVLTARHCSVRNYVDFSLQSHGLIVNGIICRTDEEMKMRDEEWKYIIVKLFSGEIEVYDDKEENLEYLKKLGVNAELYLVKGGEVIRYG